MKSEAITSNKSQLFAQASVEENISFFITSDTESIKLLKTIQLDSVPQFEIIDINTPHTEQLGLLNL